MVEDTRCRNPTEISRDGLDHSTVYRILSHPKRRALLDALNQYDEPLPLADAAEEVVRLNSDTAKFGLDQSRVKQCSISLHHRHVPQLEDGGYVTVEADDTLSLTEKGQQLFEIQQQLESENLD